MGFLNPKSWLEVIESSYYDERKTFKDPTGLPKWPNIPWDDKNIRYALRESEWALGYISNLVFLKDKIRHTHMCMEMPGRQMHSSSLTSSPAKRWEEDPISKKDFKRGVCALRIAFNNSPRLRIEVGSPYNRGFFIGTRVNVHLGGPAWNFDHTLEYTSHEERIAWVHGQNTIHYSCKQPKKFAALTPDQVTKLSEKINQNDINKLFATQEVDAHLGKRPQSWPIKQTTGTHVEDRDEVRLQNSFRTQVWERSEGVMRREGVGINFTKVCKGGILKNRGENYTEEGPMKDQPDFTPALSTDSPHILFESRPKEFCTVNSAHTAAQFFAGPHFLICGIENKPPSATDTPSITELSGYKWANHKDDEAHRNNIFAIRDKKDLSACWAGSLPTLEGSIA